MIELKALILYKNNIQQVIGDYCLKGDLSVNPL